MKKTCVLAVLLACFAAGQSLAEIRIMLPEPVAMSGTGAAITTDFVGNDEVVVTVKPSSPAEVAHYGFQLAWNPDEYQFVRTNGAAVSWTEDGQTSIATSYILKGPAAEDMSIVLRRTGPNWGRLEPQRLDVFTRNRERIIYDPAPAFTPNPDARPQRFELFQNYPNPFNPSAEIYYIVPSDGQVELAVYNLVGQTVRTLVSEFQRAGEHTIAWNATNDIGEAVAGGVYFYQLNAGGQTAVRRMLLLK